MLSGFPALQTLLASCLSLCTLSLFLEAWTRTCEWPTAYPHQRTGTLNLWIFGRSSGRLNRRSIQPALYALFSQAPFHPARCGRCPRQDCAQVGAHSRTVQQDSSLYKSTDMAGICSASGRKPVHLAFILIGRTTSMNLFDVA